MKHFERQWKHKPHGADWKSSPGVWLGFGFGEKWTRSDFSSWSDTLSFTEKKMVGLGVGCWIPILSHQLSSLRHCHWRAFSAHWNTVCSTVSGLTPFLFLLKTFLLLQPLSNNNLLWECPGVLVAYSVENVLTMSPMSFLSKYDLPFRTSLVKL